MPSTNTQLYGPIGQPYDIPIDPLLTSSQAPPGYYCFVGKNNSGKSAVLKTIARTMQTQGEKIAYIPVERTGFSQISDSQNRNNITLDAVNNEFNSLVGQNNSQNPDAWREYATKLHHAFTATKESQQKQKLEQFTKDYFNVSIESTNATYQNTDKGTSVIAEGSGLRSLFSILAALTDDSIETLFIDEPELSLEPALQKKLYLALTEVAKTKRVFVATHSHLFINREVPLNNFIVSIPVQTPVFDVVQNEAELYAKVLEGMLGVELSHSFLPDAIVVIEGESDEIIIRKLLGLGSNVYFYRLPLSAGKTVKKSKALDEHLSAYVRGGLNFYPYQNKLFVLVDYLNPDIADHAKCKADLETHFAGRWSQINEDPADGVDILNAVPEKAYKSAGMVKADELTSIEALQPKDRGKAKVEVANKLVEHLKVGMLEQSSLSGVKSLKTYLDERNIK